MEWTPIPVMVDEIQPLEFSSVQQWCDRNIPAVDITFHEELVPALCMALDLMEREL